MAGERKLQIRRKPKPGRLDTRISLVVSSEEWNAICDFVESDPEGRSLNAVLRGLVMRGIRAERRKEEDGDVSE